MWSLNLTTKKFTSSSRKPLIRFSCRQYLKLRRVKNRLTRCLMWVLEAIHHLIKCQLLMNISGLQSKRQRWSLPKTFERNPRIFEDLAVASTVSRNANPRFICLSLNYGILLDTVSSFRYRLLRRIIKEFMWRWSLSSTPRRITTLNIIWIIQTSSLLWMLFWSIKTRLGRSYYRRFYLE